MNPSTYDPSQDAETRRIMQDLSRLRGQSTRRQVLTGTAPMPNEGQGLFNLPGTTAPSPQMPVAPPPKQQFADVRANQITTPQVQQQGILSRFGKALGDLVRAMEIPSLEATEQAREQAANQPPKPFFSELRDISPFSEEFQMAQAPARQGGLELLRQTGYKPSAIPQVPSGEKPRLPLMPPPKEPQPIPEQPVVSQAPPIPETVAQPPVPVASTPEEVNVAVQQKADQPPASYVVPGASSIAMNKPEVKAQIEQMLDHTYDPKDAALLKQYEDAANAFGKSIDEITGQLDQQALAIKQRLESRNLTNQDKIMMAAVLLAPALLSGLIRGPEAALSAIGAGAGALAGHLKEREERALQAPEQLAELGIQKAKLAGAKLEPLAKLAEMRKTLRPPEVKPGKPTKQEKFIEAKEAETHVIGPDGKPYIQFQGMNVDEDAIKTEEDIKKYKDHIIPDVKKMETQTETINQGLDQMIDLIDKIKKQETFSGTFGNIVRTVGQYIPGQRIMVTLDDGRTVDAEKELNAIRENVLDTYKVWKNFRAITKEMKQHFGHLLDTPFAHGIFEGDQLENAKNQAIRLKTMADEGLLTTMSEHKIDKTEYQQRRASSPTAIKLQQNKQSEAISQYIMNSPEAQQQLIQTGKVNIGK